MAQLNADMEAAGQAFTEATVIAVPQPPAIPVADPTFYGLITSLFGVILGTMQTGVLIINQYGPTRPEQWQAPSQNYRLQTTVWGYVGGDYHEKVDGVIKTRRKVIIAGSAFAGVLHPADTITIDGLEYSILKMKRVPRAGSVVMFWNVEVGLG